MDFLIVKIVRRFLMIIIIVGLLQSYPMEQLLMENFISIGAKDSDHFYNYHIFYYTNLLYILNFCCFSSLYTKRMFAFDQK